MASVVSICNMALSEVGSTSIVSIDDNSLEAELCRLHYYTARDKVLGDREWTFAVARRELTMSAAAPVYGFPNKFQIPSDSIRILQCHDSKDINYPLDPNSTYWYKEGDEILSDSEQIWCRYIRRVEDPNLFSAGFETALATYLASKLAIPLQQNRSLKTELLQVYQLELTEAAAADGLQGRHKIIRFNRLDSARRR